MKPDYFIENQYSFVIDVTPQWSYVDHEVDTPETAFERRVQTQLGDANRLLMEGKYSAALEQYRYLRGTIAALIQPQLTIPNATLVDWTEIDSTRFADSVVAKSAEMLQKTPVIDTDIPVTFRNNNAAVSETIARKLSVFEDVGVRDAEVDVGVTLDEARVLIQDKQFSAASEKLQQAFDQSKDKTLKAAIQHDLGVVRERADDRSGAIESLKKSARAFGQVNEHESRASTLEELARVQVRGADDSGAKRTLKQAEKVRSDHNVIPIMHRSTDPITPNITDVPLHAGGSAVTAESSVMDIDTRVMTAQPARTVTTSALTAHAAQPAVRAEEVALDESFATQPAELLSFNAFANRNSVKRLTVLDGANKPHVIKLDNNSSRQLGEYYKNLSTTDDLRLLMGYLDNHTVTVAYLTHIFHWVIPMAIGDCYHALGSYEEAEKEYLDTLKYKYLNQVVESVNLWLRLAELYLDWGDRLYRQARNNVSEYSRARKKYELVMRLNNTVNNSSPLYKSSKFASMKNRVQAAIQALFVDETDIEENPRITIALMRARKMLTQIDNNLNYLGLGVHIPPFSFEYLQNVARYLAQHASQVEQMYIQFQSTGEVEELREQQMAQQADVSEASVELERRGLEEAEEGVDVAAANLNASRVQHQNARDAANEFADVRWELLELDALRAWSSAAAVDEDDEVHQSINGYTYYSADKKDRSDVLQDLAYRRNRISHDLEASRLEREVESAAAYVSVGEQQVQQAEARVDIARQRIAIAEMQARHARENLAFLEGREFSSAMWYNLAREARRLAGRYLDHAIEVATLMEKAYQAETGRNLRKIKFEYGLNHLNGMLGAEALLRDVDYFTVDYVRTKAKKAPMKQTLSLADHFPMAFERLLRTGRTFFETTLEHFDRRYPGFYLQKLKQVELVFVGLGGQEGVHGTLRNIGMSQFRRKNGDIVDQVYPADVMPLSEYDVRQDAIVFQLDSKELRLFENNGIATMWQLDLPLATNTFDLRQILDIHLVVSYDGYHSHALEQDILAAMPASSSASRGLSLRLYAPDEWFYLRNQGEAQLAVTPDLFPANQTGQTLTHYFIKVRGQNVGGLKLTVEFVELGSTHTFTLDADGVADGSNFSGPTGGSLFETWQLRIDPEQNPDFDPADLDDVTLFVEYDFDYRH